MTVFENIKNKSIDELVDWLDKHCDFDSALWWRYWDENYCDKCEAVVFTDDEGGKECFAYCEHYSNCRFFKDMDCIPDSKQIIRMWLESEVKHEKVES